MITAPIANKMCSFLAASFRPLVDFNKYTMAPKLTTDAVVINAKRKVRLESCSFAIFLTSNGWDENIIIQFILSFPWYKSKA